MTWSGLRSSGVLTGAYTLVYVTRQYSRASLSDTRHTSFYVIVPGCFGLLYCYRMGFRVFNYFSSVVVKHAVSSFI